MINYIDKELWCIKGYYGDKFHYRNVISKKYLEYSNRNLNFINNIENNLSKINKDLEEF